MEGELSSGLVSALIQLPFLAAFIWFAVKLTSDFRKDANDRDKVWIDFLAIERAQRKHAMDTGMAEVKELAAGMTKLANAVVELSHAMAQHTTEARERYDNLRQAISSHVLNMEKKLSE